MTKTIIEVDKPRQLAKKQKYDRQLKLKQTSKITQFDKQFCIVPPFTELKLFQHYRKVVQ